MLFEEHLGRTLKPDAKIQRINYLFLSCWINFLLAAVLFFMIQVPAAGFFFQDRGARITAAMHRGLGIFYLVLLALLFVLSVTGLGLNLQRRRRKSDIFHYSFIVFMLFSIAGFIMYLAF